MEIATAMADRVSPWPSAVRIDTSGSAETALNVTLGHITRCDLGGC